MQLFPERVTLSPNKVPEPPAAPEALVATEVTGFSFLARWTAVDTATNYHLDVATDAEFTVLAIANLDVAEATTHSVEGLDPDVTYFFRVRASNANGTSPNSNTRTVSTAGVVPGNPLALDANNVQDIQFNARWTVADYADSYLLSVSVAPDFSSHLVGYNDLDVGNITSALVAGLNPETTYYYRIRAINAFGTGAFSNVITTLTQVSLPEAPVALAATDADAESFIANWNASTGAADYRLDVSVAPDFSSFVPGYADRVVVGTSQSVIGLDPNTTHYYRVRAANAAGFSGYSNTISIDTLVALPDAPVALAATNVTFDSFNANWNAANNATAYRLDVSATLDFSTFLAGYQNLDVGGVLTYPVAGLDPETSYYYRVRGANAFGTSANSNVVSTTTVAFSPTSVANLELWLDGSDAATLYDSTSGGSLVAADGAIARWEDKSGNFRHATQGVLANRPTRKTATQNGLDVARFTGGHWLVSTDFYTQDITIFVVSKAAKATQVLLSKYSASDQRREYYLAYLDTDGVEFAKNEDGLSGSSHQTLNKSFVGTNCRLLECWKSGTSGEIGFDGNQSPGTFATAGVFDGPNPWTIGSHSGSASGLYPLNGDVAEVLIYSRALNAAERENVRDYLQAKWATPSMWETDFSKYTVGVQPADWTRKGNVNGPAPTVEAFAGALGGVALKFGAYSTDRFSHILHWDALENLTGGSRWEMLVRCQGTAVGSFSSDSSDCSLSHIVGTIGDPDYFEYNFGLRFWPDEVYAQRYGLSGSVLTVGNASNTRVANIWIWQRVRFEDGRLRIRVWRDPDPEPTTWLVDITDPNYISNATTVSFGVHPSRAMDNYYDYFRFELLP